MRGLMQERPLLISSFLTFAATYHQDREIVSRLVEGSLHRYTYAQAEERARRVANVLKGLGAKFGDVIGTLAWNTHRHLEVWYGTSGSGLVCHTINPRLFPEQIAYIVNHADDKVLFIDLTFVPLVEKFADKLKGVRHFVILTDRAHMPQTSLPDALCYEELVAQASPNFAWPDFDENTASSLCYTSGTTGNPKGVLYSHRSTAIHSMVANNADAFGLRSVDAVLPVVPMFHANAWSIPYGAPMAGAKLVMPGAALDGASVYNLLETEGVTMTAAVPTIWLMLLQYLEKEEKTLSTLKRVVIGGSAAPRSMIDTFQEKYGVSVCHAWGMTEMSPLGTLGTLKAGMDTWPKEKRLDVQCKQGRAVFGVDLKITDDDGKELPRDGKAFGHLMVRGPWIANAYLKGEGGNILDENGYFDTGDVATLDPEGFMQITDRAKDVIKSGGEWISSIDLENAAVGHPSVAEAAVIGIVHPKWDERPLLIVVRKAGKDISREEMLDFLVGKIAKWWMPDDVVFVDELPHTATGKLLKTKLREDFKDYTLPTAQTAAE
ncbi:long-chain-fatty-acid--CoA ligase [Oleomonas cavernae]|uniref:3-methylmercaptopropionyl-CoA ligase n=1 Tax=Oleomonas cavernae TaxID=2320859 RepID=A0A418WTN8_9PROT|nr:3-(methylthio)propionyl-CoA ligase [Oleomonas cavernae]RJF94633.1 long-chain-fatty-acid--CoA ligase [Oleomonas cavernae]